MSNGHALFDSSVDISMPFETELGRVKTEEAARALVAEFAEVSLMTPGTPLTFEIGEDHQAGSDSDEDSLTDTLSVVSETSDDTVPGILERAGSKDLIQSKSPLMIFLERLDRRPRRKNSGTSSPSKNDINNSPLSTPPASQNNKNLDNAMPVRVSATRQPTLPPKDEDEDRRHLKMHEQMVKEARKREERKILERRKKRDIREKHMAEWTAIWVNDIIPKWNIKHNDKRTTHLWKQGLPPKVRGQVWMLGTGNALNITDELFSICLQRAKLALTTQVNHNHAPTSLNVANASSETLGKEDSVALISIDLSRTFPTLGIFQPNGPFYNQLREILMAYVCYRPDIGYVQGMSFLAAMLILNLEEKDAFKTLCNLLNRRCHMSFFQMDTEKINCYKSLLNQLIADFLPVIHEIFDKLRITVDIFLYEWILTLFSKSLPLEVSSRIWDRYILQGDRFLFRVCLGILRFMESRFVDQPFEVVAYDLTHLPQSLEVEELFVHIDAVKLSRSKYHAALAAAFPASADVFD